MQYYILSLQPTVRHMAQHMSPAEFKSKSNLQNYLLYLSDGDGN